MMSKDKHGDSQTNTAGGKGQNAKAQIFIQLTIYTAIPSGKDIFQNKSVKQHSLTSQTRMVLSDCDTNENNILCDYIGMEWEDSPCGL